jgi:hypothetical protein
MIPPDPCLMVGRLGPARRPHIIHMNYAARFGRRASPAVKPGRARLGPRSQAEGFRRVNTPPVSGAANGAAHVQASATGQAAQLAAATRKREVSNDKAKALSSPRLRAPETAKARARAKLQQIREWLKIARKLFAQDPKGMAHALAQAFKDLKAAIRDYKAAMGQELDLGGEVVSGAIGPAPTAQVSAEPDDALPEAPGATSDDASTDPSVTPEQAAPPAGGSSIYETVEAEFRKAIGEDGLAFAKEVREFVHALSDLLEAARGQAKAARRDKTTDRAFEEADKSLKSLNTALSDMQSEIHDQVPAAGMRLSIAA